MIVWLVMTPIYLILALVAVLVLFGTMAAVWNYPRATITALILIAGFLTLVAY